VRATVAFAAALWLSGCAYLSELGLVPAPGSEHLQSDPTMCGSLQDPVRRGNVADTIVGAADFHLHQFANIGFGGRLVWGDSFHSGGIETALPECGVTELCADGKEALICNEVLCRFASDRDKCRAECERHKCDSPPPHGRAGLTDPLSTVLREKVGHSVTGFPEFDGWPAYNSFTHQQVYHRWLRRAFDGGMKLMVMLAVTNETLCDLWEHDHACDDMTNVDLQLEAARELETFVDYQNDCAVNGNGWYRIAESPREAREIIADGALAVVLGIEVDTLFNCYKDKPLTTRTECTEALVEAEIQKYRALGVRHLFPIHLFDNGFGGAAASEDFFNFGNGYVNQELFDVRDCSDTYSFRFGAMPSTVDDFLSVAAKKLGFPYERYDDMKAHCNQRGLTGLGELAIMQLMKHKMIIDLDHMSASSRGRVLELATQRKYPGLLSSHTGFTKVNIGDKRHEGQLTESEVDKLLALGGLFAPILNQGNLKEVKTYERKQGTQIVVDCGSSSKGFAQAYFYAVDQVKRFRADGRVIGVGFGSDLNGLVASPSPRFGKYACDGDRKKAQTADVEYPITTYRQIGGLMDRSVVANRTYDINTDGYAHVGMFPDFVADLNAIGVTDEDLEPLFHSAEAYIQLWERVEATAP